jgi:pimeloyl-ACP methyl ester carboxylesterase
MTASITPSQPLQHYQPPSTWLLFAEGRALLEAGASLALWPLLQGAPRGDGHAVMVLPRLMAGDDSTALLRQYLAERGYDVHGWGQGRNLGPRKGVEQGMLVLLDGRYDTSGAAVSIVGWSLGGVYARLLAARRPKQVRSVVTLGSPFAGGPRSTNAWRVYEAVSGVKAENGKRKRLIELTPEVPTTSIFSRSDGVVAWHCSVERAGPTAENIEVVASHLGLGAHRAVLYALADRLAQPLGGWKAFQRGLLGPLLYPDPDRPH